MNVDTGIWDKLTKVVVSLLVIAILVAVGFWYLPLIKQNEQFRKEILRLEADISTEQERSKQLSAQIDTLQRDPRAVERIAREKLALSKPGETVIRFEGAEPPRAQ
jgi:cell division protein FtsB